MSQIFKENIPLLSKTTGTTLTLAATYEGSPGRVTVGGRQYAVSTAKVLNTATVGLNGLDTGTLAANTLYYVYCVRSTSAGFGIVASLAAPSVGPTGFTGWKEIGRFRTFFGSAAISTVVNKLEGNNKTPPPQEWYTAATEAILKYATTTATNVGSYSSKIRRNGDSADMQIRITFAGPANANGLYTVFFPEGLAYDQNKMPGASAGYIYWNAYLSTATNKVYDGAINLTSANSFLIYPVDGAGGSATGWTGNTAGASNSPGGVALGASDWLIVELKGIPIAEFSGL